MTNDEFLKALEAYRAIIKPQTYQSLTEAVKADRIKDEVKDVLLDQMELSQQMLGALEAVEEKQKVIYQKGIDDLNILKNEALSTYKKVIQEAEKENQEQESEDAEKILTNF